MEENKIPMPTGLSQIPDPTIRTEPSESGPAPEPKTEPAPETIPQPDEEEKEEENDDQSFGNYLKETDPRLLIACSALFGACLPLLNIILPFIFWILWREKDPRLEEVSRNVLNIQLTATMWIIISAMTVTIVIGSVLLPLAILGWAFATIAYTLKLSNRNYNWLPPGTIPFIR